MTTPPNNGLPSLIDDDAATELGNKLAKKVIELKAVSRDVDPAKELIFAISRTLSFAELVAVSKECSVAIRSAQQRERDLKKTQQVAGKKPKRPSLNIDDDHTYY